MFTRERRETGGRKKAGASRNRGLEAARRRVMKKENKYKNTVRPNNIQYVDI